MLLGALLLLAAPAQATAPEPAPSLGDPRRRGGARDLFEEDDGDDPSVRQTTAFRLRPKAIEHVGPLAVTSTGRYAAYGLTRSGHGTHVVVVDTASATVRAAGPRLTSTPQATALSATRLFVAAGDQLLDHPWGAAESARQAWSRPAPTPAITTLPPGGRTEQVITSERAALVALLRQDAEGWSVHRRSLDGGPLTSVALDVPADARCPSMTFAAEGLLLVAGCQTVDGAVAFRVPTDGGKLKRIPLTSPDRGAVLTSLSALGSLPITGWDVDGRGLLALHAADGRITKRVSTDQPPRAAQAAGNSAVVVEQDGSVWLVGLGSGATRLGVGSPALGERGATQATPAIAADGSTVIIADNGSAGTPPKLWVVPAIQ
jgi:hypothetical protein